VSGIGLNLFTENPYQEFFAEFLDRYSLKRFRSATLFQKPLPLLVTLPLSSLATPLIAKSLRAIRFLKTSAAMLAIHTNNKKQ